MDTEKITKIIKNKKAMAIISGAMLMIGIICAMMASVVRGIGQEWAANNMMEIAKIFIILFIAIAAIMILTTDFLDFKKKDEKEKKEEQK